VSHEKGRLAEPPWSSFEPLLVLLLFVFALTVALFAIRALHVFALLIGTTRLSLTLLITLLVRLLGVVGH
jgi:hypothetical protein